ncbi:MAG: threonine synthase [Lachnospiraceae bacterium]|nr:threonine synthase [Lachnospiraceae bacterium]
MEILYHSTRDKNIKLTASQAILQGLAEDGGLFVPEKMPVLDKSIEELKGMDYRQTAYEVMKLFFTDYTEDELKNCIAKAYDEKFDCEEIAPIAAAGGAYYLELFHGATIAFKDMALSILPHLMTTAAKKNALKEEIVILTATSGDTGKAALAGFADVPGTRIMVFYPKNGVSAVQERQMVTQRGSNVRVVGITGNFDDAQTGVKQIFNDAEMKEELKQKGFVFSSANSINIGRLIPQVVYYVYAYTTLLRSGRIHDKEAINVCVPTGNFGNILAAFYAKQLGIPIAKLICASNKNRVLTDFFASGTYDKLHERNEANGSFDSERSFVLTGSPSMDILISSNLERLIWQIAGCDEEKNAALMKELNAKGSYAISDDMKEKLADFSYGYASEEDTAEKIRSLYADCSYVIDPHTAVAGMVYDRYRKESGDETPTVIASTASPYKFARTVLCAIDPEYGKLGDMELIDKLQEVSKVDIPQAIEDIRSAPVLHDIVCETADMPREVREFLK